MKFFHWHKKNNLETSAPATLRPLRIVISGRDDTTTIGFKKVIADSFEKLPFFVVSTETDSTFINFLTDDNKNFFDFFDNGNKILQKHHAQILLNFESHHNNLVINFLTPDMYLISTPPFFSTLYKICLPISYFQNAVLPNAVFNLLVATCLALCSKHDSKYNKLHARFVKILSKNKKPEDIDKPYIPNILFFLAFNFLASKAPYLEKQDVKLILNLVHTAYKTDGNNTLLNGGLFCLLGQTYQCGANSKKADAELLIQRAINSYKKALKNFNRYVFPYDYGRLSLVLAKLHFSIFKLSDERQFLRDAVSYLREAEKIFTFQSFPHLWADIQGDLGYWLTSLGMLSHNKEIIEIAVQNYKNRQRAYTSDTYPELWAYTEKNIGDTYYYFGKDTDNVSYLQKASNHYLNALDVFEKLKDTNSVRLIENLLDKTDEKILHLNNK